MKLLKLSLPELISRADALRRKHTGKRLELCAIVNAKSGRCPEDCKFCAQSARYSTNVCAYPLKSKTEIIKRAKFAKTAGAKMFGIVTSGNKPDAREIKKLAVVISEIKKNVDIEPCASMGALDLDELRALKASGLRRYHHNIETSPRFYKKIVTTHRFEDRIRTIEAAKRAGLEVCSGGIIGMGESWRDRIEMARLLKTLDVDSIPVNILVPIKGTPLESVRPIARADVVKTIAIFRIILKDKAIKIAAGRGAALRDFQGLGFLSGANGMLIGDYLTVKGREAGDDRALIKEVEILWRD